MSNFEISETTGDNKTTKTRSPWFTIDLYFFFIRVYRQTVKKTEPGVVWRRMPVGSRVKIIETPEGELKVSTFESIDGGKK